MKRTVLTYISLLLSALTLLTLTACGETAPPEEVRTTAAADTAPISTDSSYEAEIPDEKYDFDFVIASTYATSTKYTANFITASEITGDLMVDAVFRRTAKIKDRFNVNLVEESVKTDQITHAYKSGDRPYALGTADLSNIMTCVNAGAAVNLKDISSLQLDKPWWDQNANNKFRIGDNLYYTLSDFFITGIDNSRCVYFNKKMATDLNLGNLYSLVSQNTWTIEKMAELSVSAKDDADGNGVITTADTIGITGRSVTFYEAMLSGTDAELVKQSDSGIPYFCPFDETDFFVDVYGKLLDLFGSTNIYFPCSTDDGRTMFEEGRGLFTVDTMYLCALMRQNSPVNFGIMPMPKFNADQKNYLHVSPNPHVFFLIPSDQETLERDGVILNAASFYSSASYSNDAVMPCYFQLALLTKSATDTESAGNLQIVHDNISYVIKIVSTSFSGDVYNQFAAGTREITSFLKNNERSEKTKLDKVLTGLGITKE